VNGLIQQDNGDALAPAQESHFGGNSDGESMVLPLPRLELQAMHILGPNDSNYEMNSRSDLIQFICALQDDLKQHPENWENSDLYSYLGALAGFLGDAHGYYRNKKEDVDPDVPSWRLLADSLQAATVYE
jgi:hypothetical protein